ncbi:MAG: hypothetical protein WC455_23330 [Dehalococcoidia bacterium]|jgi:hypothetical protein
MRRLFWPETRQWHYCDAHGGVILVSSLEMELSPKDAEQRVRDIIANQLRGMSITETGQALWDGNIDVWSWIADRRRRREEGSR